MLICIYQIRNLINNKVYIGQTVDETRRRCNHFFLLRKGIHHSQKLQRAYNKYGESNFVFEVLEECEKSQLNDKEKWWIANKDSYNSGYNCNEGGQFRTDMHGENNSMYGRTGKNSPRFIDYIIQLDLKGNLLGRYESLKTAAEAVNGDQSTIRKCLIHQRKKHKDCIWLYEKEYLKNDIV